MDGCNRERLTQDLLGELDTTQHREMRVHVDHCSDCQELQKQLDQLFLQSQRLVNRKNLLLSSKINAALAQERREQKTPWSSWVIPVAGVAAGLVMAILLYSQDPKPHGPSHSVAQLRALQMDNGSWAGRVGTTALATLALLQNPSSDQSALDHHRVSNALHFLTRERSADAVEELLRCMTLLAEKEKQGNAPGPQLSLAMQIAVRKAEQSRDPLLVPLLREIVERGQRLKLASSDGDALLGRLALEFGEHVLQKPNWQQVSERLLQSDVSQENQNSVRLAGVYLSQIL